MKNGSFGKEKDCPIKKRDENNSSDDDADLDISDEINEIKKQKENKNNKKSESSDDSFEINKNNKKISFSSDSENNDSDKSDYSNELNKKKEKEKEKNIKKEEDSNINKNNNIEKEKEKEKEKEEEKKEEKEESKKIKDNDKQIEDMLLTSIKNKENPTSQKIKMAEEINFGSIPDKLIDTDEYGFIKNQNKIEENEKEKNSEMLKINARLEKWQYMIQNYEEFKTKKSSKLKSRTRKGIPDSLRSYVWQLFAEKEKYYEKDIFKKLDSRKIKEDLEIVIIKDLDRTFPNCQLFKDKYGNGQRKLYKVLSNYSKYNESTGYVQGMGFIVAVFLTYMDEESSFFMLHSLMKKYELEGFYLPGFPELKKTFYILLNLEKKFVPKVYELFKKEGMIPSMYSSEWFICLFSRNLEFNTLVRIFDVFLLEGYKVIYRFALAFLKSKEDEFLKGKDGLASIMQTINKCYENVDIDYLFKIAFGFSLSRKDIDKLGNEYDKVKNDEKNEFVKQL